MEATHPARGAHARLRVKEVEEINRRFSGASPGEFLEWAVGAFGGNLTFACSFGFEDVVLLDVISRLPTRPRVFFLDTGRLHQETYDVVEAARKKYGLAIETYFPKAEDVQRIMNQGGPNQFYGSLAARKECCHVRKVEPLARALSGVDAWITGLRKEQSATRTELRRLELDLGNPELFKLNPLVDWTSEQVASYVRENNVPYNALHEKGFPSIGCAPCTRAIEPGEDIRAGRWWWEDKLHKECGLHAGASGRTVAVSTGGRP